MRISCFGIKAYFSLPHSIFIIHHEFISYFPASHRLATTTTITTLAATAVAPTTNLSQFFQLVSSNDVNVDFDGKIQYEIVDDFILLHRLGAFEVSEYRANDI